MAQPSSRRSAAVGDAGQRVLMGEALKIGARGFEPERERGDPAEGKAGDYQRDQHRCDHRAGVVDLAEQGEGEMGKGGRGEYRSAHHPQPGAPQPCAHRAARTGGGDRAVFRREGSGVRHAGSGYRPTSRECLNAPLRDGGLGGWGKACYSGAADVEICDGLRNLRSASALGLPHRPRRLSDDDFLSLDDTTHYPSPHFAVGQLIVLERNTP